MSATDIVIVLVIAAVISLAVWKIRRDKKKGVCTGCAAASGACSSRSCSSCPGQIK